MVNIVEFIFYYMNFSIKLIKLLYLEFMDDYIKNIFN